MFGAVRDATGTGPLPDGVVELTSAELDEVAGGSLPQFVADFGRWMRAQSAKVVEILKSSPEPSFVCPPAGGCIPTKRQDP